MVRSVAFYTFAVICTSLLLDGSLKVHGLKQSFGTLEAEAEKLLKDLAEYTDGLQKANQDVIQDRHDAVVQVVQETKNSMKKKLEKAKSEGKDVSRCQKVAESKADQSITMGEAEINACLDPYMNKLKNVFNKVDAVRVPIRKVVEEIKTAGKKCSLKSLTPAESNRCTVKNVASLRTALDDVKSKSTDASHGGYAYFADVLKNGHKCVDKTTSGSLKSILKAIEAEADRCVGAAKKIK